MADTLYGLDPNQPLTPLAVRDALSECFYQAHCEDSELGDNEQISRSYCTSLVHKMFIDNGLNYDHPTKTDLTEAVNALKIFSQHFRSPEVIAKHASEITTLINQLP